MCQVLEVERLMRGNGLRALLRIPLLLFLCGAALPGGAATAELNEVAVIGKKPRELKREAIAAEDRFYERYNMLNTRDDFDIHCRMDKATGTNVPQRQCRIQFLADAGAMDGREFYMGLTNGSGARGVNTPNARLLPLWLQRREEYLQAARALLEKDPELMALATEWVRLWARYDQARK
jgi:hypothetical protein